ncbi:hypothetical protein ElyMa_002045600 [Elysia marginata]|uniref:EGF-like domain-containing protein n=1 Tax=Elysia marginata TaxID=1093978 RepID=A0AAV4FA15_9GAST|nr:hypothetical protein ElyMa_002045600 [Elysia marginata]
MAGLKSIRMVAIWSLVVYAGCVFCLDDAGGPATESYSYTVESLCHSNRRPTTVKGCTVEQDYQQVKTFVFRPTLVCARHCSSDSLCIGYSFHPGQTGCFLHYNCGNPQSCEDPLKFSDVVFYRRSATRSECDRVGGEWREVDQTCQCQGGHVGRRCERLPVSCSELALWGYRLKYQTQLCIKPHGFKHNIIVACLLDDESFTAYTLFMRNKNKFDYHSPKGKKLSQVYKDIRIGDKSTHYALSYSANHGPETFLPDFPSVQNCLPLPRSGSSGEGSGGTRPGIPFSAPDADHDLDLHRHCALVAGRAWWFTRCSKTQPACSLLEDLSNPGGGEAVWFSGKPVVDATTKAFFADNYAARFPGM